MTEEANVLPSGNPFVGINVYLSLQLELPTQIDLRTKSCGNRVFGELYASLSTSFHPPMCPAAIQPHLRLTSAPLSSCGRYWDQDSVREKYGDAADTFEPDLVFTNIIDRKSLTSAAGKIGKADCTRGFCSADIPDGQMNRKVEFFAGVFTEEYQLENYPFDTQVFEFNFTLYANLGSVAMYSPEVNLALDRDHGAYYMHSMACSSQVTDHGSFGSCRMTATRNFAPVLLNLLTPTMLFVLIAILSLKLNIKLAMPRVGSTLFALLILTQYRNSALAKLPATSSFIWLDLFLFVCSFLVWVVLVLHVFGDHLHQSGTGLCGRSDPRDRESQFHHHRLPETASPVGRESRPRRRPPFHPGNRGAAAQSPMVSSRFNSPICIPH